MPLKEGKYVFFDREMCYSDHGSNVVTPERDAEDANPSDWHYKEHGFPIPRHYDIVEHKDWWPQIALEGHAGLEWHPLWHDQAMKLVERINEVFGGGRWVWEPEEDKDAA